MPDDVYIRDLRDDVAVSIISYGLQALGGGAIISLMYSPWSHFCVLCGFKFE